MLEVKEGIETSGTKSDIIQQLLVENLGSNSELNRFEDEVIIEQLTGFNVCDELLHIELGEP